MLRTVSLPNGRSKGTEGMVAGWKGYSNNFCFNEANVSSLTPAFVLM